MNKLILALVGLALIGVLAVVEVSAYYQYMNSIGSYWELSDKASTLEQKSAYLDQYVAAIEKPGAFAPYNATLFPTPDNSFAQNLIALKSLQGRMHRIQSMNEQSFAYQTAMQQITGQEQDEGGAMTDTFWGCWFLQNHYFLWGWHDVILWILAILPLSFSIGWAMADA